MPTQTVVIGAGQSVVLPAGAVVTSIIYDGNITAESTCDNLPEPSSYKCGRFYFNLDDDENPNHPNDEDSTYFHSIKFGSTTVSLDGLVLSTNEVGLNTYLVGQTAIFSFTNVVISQVDDDGTDKREAVFVSFKVPEYLFDQVELGIIGNKDLPASNPLPSIQYYKPYDVIEC